MKKLCSALTAVMLLAPLSAHAEWLFVPKYHRQGDLACYTFEEAKELARLDAKLVLCSEWEEMYPRLVENLRLQLKNTAIELDAKEKEIAALQDYRKKRDLELESCIKEKNDALADQGSAVGWLVAGGTVLLAGGVLLGYWLAEQ